MDLQTACGTDVLPSGGTTREKVGVRGTETSDDRLDAQSLEKIERMDTTHVRHRE